MAVMTVAQFAAQLGRPTTALLEQLQSAGVTKQSADDALTDLRDRARLPLDRRDLVEVDVRLIVAPRGVQDVAHLRGR